MPKASGARTTLPGRVTRSADAVFTMGRWLAPRQGGLPLAQLGENVTLRRAFIALGVCVAPLCLAGLLGAVAALAVGGEVFACFNLVYFRASVGIPLAAITSLTTVVLLGTSVSGDFTFEALGFGLEGPSAPILLWLVCFLGICGALALLVPEVSVDKLPSVLASVCAA